MGQASVAASSRGAQAAAGAHAGPAEALQPLDPDRPPRATILVVDDEEDIRESLKTVLEECLPVQVETASDGREALDLIQAGRRFDVLLVDERMPRMRGTELLAALPPDGVAAGARFLMSAYGDRSGELARTAGVTGFLPKPFLVRDLVTRIEPLLG